MTRQELQQACSQYTLTAPVTLDDCREIFEDLKPRITAGLPLDVVRLSDRAIRVSVGPTGSTYSVEIQA